MSVDHYENFPVASLLLPRHLRPAVTAIYRFARYADDLADEGNASPQQRLDALSALDSQLAYWQSYANLPTPSEKILHSLPRVVTRYGLDIQLLRDLISAFSQDVVQNRYEDYSQLLDYCRRSANPVGRLMLKLYGAEQTQRNLLQSDAICTALQLINFWQDIAMDLQKNRIYLPKEDLIKFGVSEQSLLEQPALLMQQNQWQQLMAFQIHRSVLLMGQGAPLAWQLRGRVGLELRAIVQGGLRIAQKLEKRKFNVVRHRPTLKSYDWVLVGWRTLFSRPQ
ncbi:MAG: squalene synthase HpnC [Burkholderiaceae bacterium]|nr:squalene synthase HpnC [Burkholderiaceae bacterium]